MIVITKVNPPLQNKEIQLTDEEWETLKKYIIEDAIEFHKAVLVDFKEFAADFPEELESAKHKEAFLYNRSLFEKLKQLGIDTKGFEKFNEQW